MESNTFVHYTYFDEELYNNRFKIEQANGRLDGYKGLIMRYKYLDVTWNALIRVYLQVPQKSLNTFTVKFLKFVVQSVEANIRIMKTLGLL